MATEGGRRGALVVIVVALVLLHVGLALHAASSKSAVFDEPAHIAGGMAWWTHGDARLHPENGALPQRWAAAPHALAGRRFPPPEGEAWRRSDVWALGHAFLHDPDHGPARTLAPSRAAMAILGAALCVAVFLWSRRLHGTAGGLVSLSYCALSPTVLAHAPLATSDVAAALFFLLATAALHRALEGPTPGRVALAALAAGGLALAKFSAVILVPVAVALVAVRAFDGRPLAVRAGPWSRELSSARARALAGGAVLLAVAAGAALAIWAAFGFRYSAFAAPDPGATLQRPWEWIREGPAWAVAFTDVAREHHLLPEAWIYGLGHTARGAAVRSAYFFGEHGRTGWATFFPAAFAVKSTIPELLLFGIAAALGAARVRAAFRAAPGGGGRAAAAEALSPAARPLVLLVLVYGAAAVASNLNIGHRHLLPLYPPLFVLAGCVAGPRAAPFLRTRVAGLLVALHAAAALVVHPHHLAYFNEFVGGPRNGHRCLVDSSLDWGQDLPALERRLSAIAAKEGAAPRAYLAYFGMEDPERRGVRAERLLSAPLDRREGPPPPLAAGVYCVSATVLRSVYAAARGPWTEEYERLWLPLHAAFAPVLRLPPDEVARALRASPLPEEDLALALSRYEHLRTARLCAYLRTREPDDFAGWSILLYRLSDADLAAALDGPASR
jgi:hypothetical protein